jgi:serine phosphatase RsbU (regulator of sigma subunit)
VTTSNVTGNGGMTGGKANILICDDEPRNLLVLHALLDDLGQNIVEAHSGEQVLRHVNSSEFAVIVLDVRMPGLDGLETAQLIRQRKKTRHTPIIFLTAHHDDGQLLRGYAAGGVDYLVKPVASEILRSKVSIFVELFRMTQESRRHAEEIRRMERIAHEQQLAEALREVEATRMRTELKIANNIQSALYPRGNTTWPGLELHGATRPAEETAGDYFDYLRLSDGSLGLVIGDVSGHGVGPALLMSATRAYLRALARSYWQPDQILSQVNDMLLEDVDNRNFVTLLLARIDPTGRTLTYSSAGHPDGYILDAKGEVSAVLESTSLPLGILSNAEFPCSEPRELSPDAVIFLHTDGIMEAMTTEGELFGAPRALEVVQQHRHEPAEAIAQALFAAAQAFAHPARQHDDMTALIVKSLPAPAILEPVEQPRPAPRKRRRRVAA